MVESLPTRPRLLRLRSVLLALSLLILLLPLGGISLLRLYDSMLVRHAEAELIAQGVVLAETWRRELIRAQAEQGENSTYGRPRIRLPPPPSPGEEPSRFHPIPPRLDLARDEVWPPAPPGLPTEKATDALARQAGRHVGDLLVEVQEFTLAGLRVVDFEGRVVASSGAELGLSLAHRPEVSTALEGEAVSVLRRRTPSAQPADTVTNTVEGTAENRRPLPSLKSLSRRPAVRVVVVLPVIAEDRVWGAVVLSRTPKSVLRELYENRRYFVPGVVILLLVVTLVSVCGARLLGRPLEALIAQSERVQRGEGTARPLDHPGTLEVHRISVAVAEMARVLQRRAEYIATFATNVSHELKTPLTSIHGTVELLRDHLDEMTPEELERFLTMLERDAARLEHLVNRLLELARADVARPGEEITNLAPRLRKIMRRFEQEGMHIELAEHSEALVTMAPEVLDSIVGNLVDNARQHGGAAVHVTLEARNHDDHHVLLNIADDGPGISTANQPRVFDRFFTTSSGSGATSSGSGATRSGSGATRRDHGGSGLGLSIVKALVEAHGGTIGLTSEPGNTQFEILLCKPRVKVEG